VKILFDKVGQNAKPFHEEIEGTVLNGTLQKSGYHRVLLLGEMKGRVPVECNRCGKEFDYLFDTALKLTISDQIVEAKDDLDIIEFLDGNIDISFILQSEINTIKSEYYYCDQCHEGEEAFEMEF